MGQTAGQFLPDKVWDLKEVIPFLELLKTPAWIYDAKAGRNLWGNKAALQLFNCTWGAFTGSQLAAWEEHLGNDAKVGSCGLLSQLQASSDSLKVATKDEKGASMVLQQPWHPQAGLLPLPNSVNQVAVVAQRMKVLVKVTLVKALLIQAMDVRVPILNEKQLQLDGHASIQEPGGPVSIRTCNGGSDADCSSDASPVTSGTAAFPEATSVSATCGGTACMQEQYLNGTGKQHQEEEAGQRQQAQRLGHMEQRLMAMCNNHAMFHFLFNREGQLLAANKRAMENMHEHLGEQETFRLPDYWAMGTAEPGVTPGLSPEQHFQEAARALFELHEPCYRLPQLRWSKRHPGKSRWVLHEMWPMPDPVTGKMAILMTEQNISQVKAEEQKYSTQMRQLESQLEAALQAAEQQQQPGDLDTPLIDVDSAAEKTLQLLDRMLQGLPVTMEDAEELRAAIIEANNDMAQPLFLKEQLLESTRVNGMEPEVGASLLQMLSQHNDAGGQDVEDLAFPGYASARGSAENLEVLTTSSSATNLNALVAKLVPEQEILSPVISPREKVEVLLGDIDNWQFDSFKLAEAANNRPLSLLTFHLLQRMQLTRRYKVDERKLAKWLMRIEDGYPDNPYHNRTHAADVIRTAHVICTRGGLLAGTRTDELTLLALYLSAAIHDYGHRGVNNDFLVRTGDKLAIRYNDRSPQENHHLAASFDLLSKEELNWMKGLSTKQKEQLRKLVIEMVLATDMKSHFSIQGLFQSKVNHTPAASMKSTPTHSLHHGSHALSRGTSNVSAADSSQLPHLTHSPSNSSLILNPQTSGCGAGAVGSGSCSSSNSIMPLAVPPSLVAKEQQQSLQPADGVGPLSSSSMGLATVPERLTSGGSSSSRRLSLDCGPLAAPRPIPGRMSLDCSRPQGLTTWTAVPASLPSYFMNSSREGSKDALPPIPSQSSFIMKSYRHTVGSRRQAPAPEEDQETISLYLQVALKCADLGHLTCARSVHLRWVKCLEEELFRQGDKEKAARLNISPLMDRSKAGVTKSQVGFFDIVALPLFQGYVQRFPPAEPLLEGLRDNYQMWKIEAAMESSLFK